MQAYLKNKIMEQLIIKENAFVIVIIACRKNAVTKKTEVVKDIQFGSGFLETYF